MDANSFSSSSVFPAISLGFTILGAIFAYVTVFFNPTIEVVTFRLRKWCMLGVFLLPAFTHLGHEGQDFLSPCDGMCAQIRPRFILSPERVFGRMESEPMLTPLCRKKISSEGDRTHNAASSRTTSPAHYQQAIPVPGNQLNAMHLQKDKC